MELLLQRDKATLFTLPEHVERYTDLTIWHCKYKTLQALSHFKSLKSLTVASFPDEALEAVAALTRLESLRLLHFPKVRSLEPLTQLIELRSLSLETLPSWDASGKRLTVPSLAPLAALPRLEHLRLLGVVPVDRSLHNLETAPFLRTGQFHGYPQAEVARFRKATNVTTPTREA